MDKIRFGIIGCGNIARRFATALNQSDVAEFYACAARENEKASAFAEKYGARKSYGSYEALLEDENVQAVYIATVHTAHAEIAKMCIRAGKPLICEKPFFISSKEAEETIALAKEKGVLIMEGFWTRTMPAFQKAMEWIRDGKIGEMKFIRAAFCFNMPYNEQFRSHRIWNPDLAGGALWDAGVYPYEYVTGIMGEPPAQLKTIVQRAETGVDATVTMSMRFSNGVIADCMTSVNGFMDSEAVISGTKGYIRQYYFVGCRKAELYTGRGELTETFEDPVEEGFVHEVAHFVELLRAGKLESDVIPLADTLDFTKAAEKILASDKPAEPEKLFGYTPADLAAQEEACRFESFTVGDAVKLGQLLSEISQAEGKSAAVQIEMGGFEVYRSMPEGTGRYNDLWMQKKKNTVKLMNKSTLRLWADMAARGIQCQMSMVPGDIVCCGGGFPICLKDGTMVGVIAVSGPAGDQYEHELVVRAIKKLQEA